MIVLRSEKMCIRDSLRAVRYSHRADKHPLRHHCHADGKDAGAPVPAEQKTCHDPDQYHRQYHGYQNLHQEIGSIAGHAIPLYIMLLQYS